MAKPRETDDTTHRAEGAAQARWRFPLSSFGALWLVALVGACAAEGGSGLSAGPAAELVSEEDALLDPGTAEAVPIDVAPRSRTARRPPVGAEP